LYATKQLEHAVFCSLEWHMNKAAFWKAALSLITQVMIMPESAMNMLTQIGRTLWTSPLSYLF
jgi:Ni/Fe-hydrogenase subunit HybB-like protein